MNFEACIPSVLRFEGVYSNDEHDPGGETKYGIDKKSHPDLNIKNLTEADAIEIYRQEYWIRNDCDVVPEVLRFAYFDCCVNQGPGLAKKFIQKALGLQADGILGGQSRARFKEVAQKSKEYQADYLASFLSLRMQAYASLSNFKYFGAGWSNRLMQVSAISFKAHWASK